MGTRIQMHGLFIRAVRQLLGNIREYAAAYRGKVAGIMNAPAGLAVAIRKCGMGLKIAAAFGPVMSDNGIVLAALTDEVNMLPAGVL